MADVLFSYDTSRASPGRELLLTDGDVRRVTLVSAAAYLSSHWGPLRLKDFPVYSQQRHLIND